MILIPDADEEQDEIAKMRELSRQGPGYVCRRHQRPSC